MLPDDREDHALLKEARGLLEKQAEDLGVPRNKMPQPPRPRPTVAATDLQGTSFDPYKVRRTGALIPASLSFLLFAVF